MRKLLIRAGSLSNASISLARHRRANDNVADVEAGAAAEVCGAFTPVSFEDRYYAADADTWRNMGSRAGALRPRIAGHGERLASARGWIATALDQAAWLWTAIWGEWMVGGVAAKLSNVSDMALHDIGIRQGDIDLIARFGRAMNQEPG